MREFSNLIVYPALFVNESIEGVVQRGSGDRLLGVINVYLHITLLKHQRHNALVVHKEIDHHGGVPNTGKLKLAVDYFAGVDIHQLIVFQCFQIKHLSIQTLHGGTSLYDILF